MRPALGTEQVMASIELSRELLVYCCVSPRISILTPRARAKFTPVTFRWPISPTFCIGRCGGGRLTVSVDFVKTENLMALAVTAKTFGQRPSTMLAITEPTLALELDLAAAMCLANERIQPRNRH